MYYAIFYQLQLMGNTNQRDQHLMDYFQRESREIVKSGQMLKESKHLKAWRNRLVYMTPLEIFTFEPNNWKRLPTASIDIKRIASISTFDEKKYFGIKIITMDGDEYKFKSESEEDRKEWYKCIKNAKHRLVKESKVFKVDGFEFPNVENIDRHGRFLTL